MPVPAQEDHGHTGRKLSRIQFDYRRKNPRPCGILKRLRKLLRIDNSRCILRRIRRSNARDLHVSCIPISPTRESHCKQQRRDRDIQGLRRTPLGRKAGLPVRRRKEDRDRIRCPQHADRSGRAHLQHQFVRQSRPTHDFRQGAGLPHRLKNGGVQPGAGRLRPEYRPEGRTSSAVGIGSARSVCGQTRLHAEPHIELARAISWTPCF